MSKIAKSLTELVGNTPLLEMCNFNRDNNLKAKLLVKVESFNPLSSVKDRVAVAMIEDGEKDGRINKNTVLIEPTSGNTGVGLAFVAASKGYKLIITMPESMSIERRNLLKFLGAELILTPANKGMAGAIEKANELSKNIPNSLVVGQFTNSSNPDIHRKTTGPEIWNDTDGKIDIFVAGVGTGGTITGTSEYLKQKNPDIKIIAVEPYDSPVLSENRTGSHKIQGIGAGFVPEILNTNIYDEIIKVKNEDSFKMSKEVARTEGLLVGISSGAAIYAATEVAKMVKNAGKTIVTILPDTGERYISTELFSGM